MAKAAYQGPDEALAHYEALVARNPDVARKGAKNPYTSRNGHMFSFLDIDGTMALRMADDRYDAFVAAYDSGPVEQYGRTMRGYVRVPADLLERTDELEPWFNESHEWIGTLKPKATTRKKSATKKAAAANKKPATKKPAAANKKPATKKPAAAKNKPAAKKRSTAKQRAV